MLVFKINYICILLSLIFNLHFDTELAQCRETEFMCRNRQCILSSYHCDGDIDCADQSDEMDCPMLNVTSPCSSSEFVCDDHQCIRKAWHCDGDVDCDDGSDEKNCE